LDCEHLVHQVTGTTFAATPEVLQALPLRFLAQRLLNNLKAIYIQREDFARAVRVIGRLRQLDPDDLTQRRDLGISLVRAGEPARAVEHLAAYLAAAPHSVDTEAVLELLKRARGEPTRWN
jgi:regulator of sirC expression with transglutaminase-like and TPR domain